MSEYTHRTRIVPAAFQWLALAIALDQLINALLGGGAPEDILRSAGCEDKGKD